MFTSHNTRKLHMPACEAYGQGFTHEKLTVSEHEINRHLSQMEILTNKKR